MIGTPAFAGFPFSLPATEASSPVPLAGLAAWYYRYGIGGDRLLGLASPGPEEGAPWGGEASLAPVP